MSGFFKDFSRMSKLERFGTLYLSVIIIVVALSMILFEPVYNWVNPPVDYTSGFDSVLYVVEKEYREKQLQDSIENAARKNRNIKRRYYKGTVDEDPEKRKRFYFNPNKLSVDSFELLGFKTFVSANIEKYRTAGGSFQSAEDMKKIYEINEELINDLSSFMIFPELEEDPSRDNQTEAYTAEEFSGSDQKRNETAEWKHHKSESVFYEFDLNTADTAELKKIRGIGTYYAGNILKYKKLLGGYAQVEQLTEVYGISDSLYKSIALHFYIKDTFAPEKINLNEISAYELSRHPYVTQHLAQMIVGYRYSEGNYEKTEDLIEHRLITSVQHAKLKPYITVK